MKTPRTLSLLALIFIDASNHPAVACAACWGDTSGGKSTHAAAVGIGAMVIIVFAMLFTIIGIGWRMAWRAKNPLPDYDELLADGTAGSDPDAKS